jgi:hypothetical protein
MLMATGAAGCSKPGPVPHVDKRTQEQKAADQAVLDKIHAESRQQGGVPADTPPPSTTE